MEVQAYVIEHRWFTKAELEVYLKERNMEHFLNKVWEGAEKQYDELVGELKAKIRVR
jgi:hypothetical protein